LQEHGGFVIHVFTSLEETDRSLVLFNPQTLVLHIPYLSESHVEMIHGVRKRFPSLPLLVLAAEIEDAFRFRLSSVTAFALLCFHSELLDLPNTIHRLTEKVGSFSRAHSRTRRTDKVELRDTHGRMFQGRFEDYGRMGAKLAVASNAFRGGDRVMIQYPSTSGDTVRMIEAVIVWQAANAWPVGLLGGGLVGVKFIAYL
jgi:hypothetical protein